MEIRQEAIDRTVEFEDFIEHFYKDSLGYVTIGVGQLLTTAADAVPLRITINDNAATDVEKKAGWQAVSDAPKQPNAGGYEKFSNCRMSRSDALALCKKRLEEAAGFLKGKNAFPQIDTYPEKAQDALLDMVFNIGPTKFIEAKWSKLFLAVKAKDWTTAAKESNRKDVQASRNQKIRELFEAAALVPFVGMSARDLAAGLDELFQARLAELISLSEQKEQRFFPGGITRIAITVTLGEAKIEVDVSGPDPKAGTDEL